MDDGSSMAEPPGHLIIDGSQDLATRRRFGDRLGDIATEPRGVLERRHSIAGVDVLTSSPPGPTVGVIVHAHGGHSMCSIESHRRLAGHLALRTNRKVVLVGYRRTPEHAWTAAVDDVEAVMRSLAPGPVVLSGESAGGGIVATTALRSVGTDWTPKAVVMLSPWLDRTLSGDSMTTNDARDLFVKRSGLAVLAEEVFADNDLTDPAVSPLFADLAGFPRTLLQVASEEVLLDDSTRFGAAAEAAGVDVELQIAPGMQHAWHLAAGTLPQADEALTAIAAFLDAKPDSTC